MVDRESRESESELLEVVRAHADSGRKRLVEGVGTLMLGNASLLYNPLLSVSLITVGTGLLASSAYHWVQENRNFEKLEKRRYASSSYS